MKNSEVRIVPVAAVCDRRRTEPKNPTRCWSTGVMGRWSNLASHLSTKSIKSIKPRPNQAQSSLIKPIRTIFPFLNMTTEHKTAKFRNWQLPRSVRSNRSGNPQLVAPRWKECEAGQTSSNPVKVFPNRHHRSKSPDAHTIHCGVSSKIHNQLWLISAEDTTAARQSSARNPQPAIAVDSTYFHLIPLNSTSRPRSQMNTPGFPLRNPTKSWISGVLQCCLSPSSDYSIAPTPRGPKRLAKTLSRLTVTPDLRGRTLNGKEIFYAHLDQAASHRMKLTDVSTENGARARRRLVVNADDFGRSQSINKAVVRAHREGILTTASLMVNEPWAGEAVALARENPVLGVGLHLVLVCGAAALPTNEIPQLADGNGQFSKNSVAAGWRYFASAKCRAQLRLEIAAQFERFRATGLQMDHVNGHLHLHLHPVVFGILMENADRWGITAVRLTDDRLRLNARLASGRWGCRLSHAAIFRALSARARPALERKGIRHTNAVFGLLQNGRVSSEFVGKLLRVLPSGDSELYSHPSLDQFRDEFEALINPTNKMLAAELGIQLIRYQDL